MSSVAIQIVDLRTGRPGSPCEATLHTEVTPAQLVAVERAWKLERMKRLFDLIRRGVPKEQLPQHFHWDWERKAPALNFLANQCFGIECEGEWQGLMMTTTVGHLAQLPGASGRPVVYVKYIESAPWNLASMTQTPRFGAVGTRLLEAAVRQSLEEGFHGRVGLHALPNAATEGFYQRKGLVRLGIDAAVEDLPYYELSGEAAARFLSGGQG